MLINIIRELHVCGCDVDVADPWASEGEVEYVYGLSVLSGLDAIERGACRYGYGRAPGVRGCESAGVGR